MGKGLIGQNRGRGCPPCPPSPSVPTALPQIDHPPLILPRGVKDGTIELLLQVILGFD